MFSIGLGWAFTNIVNAECLADLTPTCPETITFRNTVEYIITVVCYLVIIAVSYHIMLGGFRLRSRAAKVSLCEEGNSDQLFKEVDKDSNGTITCDELNGFLETSGIDGQIFETAYKSKMDTDGTVQTAVLIAEFTKLITQMQAEANPTSLLRCDSVAKEPTVTYAEDVVSVELNSVPGDAKGRIFVVEPVDEVNFVVNANPLNISM